MFFGFRAFQESLKSQDSLTKNLKKQLLFLRFLGFQAFLESFKSQDSRTKNLKKQLLFSVFGISGLSRELPMPRLPHQKP